MPSDLWASLSARGFSAISLDMPTSLPARVRRRAILG
jgi:hypothetical protein